MLAEAVRVTALVALIGVAIASPTTPSAMAAESTPTRLRLEIDEPSQPELPYRIAATLTTPDGTPVNGASVSLHAVVDVLGERTAPLGTGTTDAAGTTSVAITPRKPTYQIVARFDGDSDHAATEHTESVTFPDDAVVPFAANETHDLLTPIRATMPRAISVAVATLWGGLLLLAVWTVLAIRRHGEADPVDRAKETLS